MKFTEYLNEIKSNKKYEIIDDIVHITKSNYVSMHKDYKTKLGNDNMLLVNHKGKTQMLGIKYV